ncbi:MAG: hypothetical protein AAFX10_00870, partial [Pseudomonadota bacterium]
MIPVSLSRSFLASVIFLGAAINVDANPREAKVDPEAQAEDTLPVVIEIPNQALTLDTAPVIEMDDIADALEDAYVRGKTHAIAVIAEGAPFKTTDLAEYLNITHPV